MTTNEKSLWKRSIEIVMKAAGGWSDDPCDLRGPMRWGVTQDTLDAAREKGLTSVSLKDLTVEEAEKIYQAFYWEPFGWEEQPWPLCLILLDLTVNHGPEGMARILQKALNDRGQPTVVDGRCGPNTLMALKLVAAKDPRGLAETLLARRAACYDAIVEADPSQIRFLDGWRNQIRTLAEAAGIQPPV